MQEFNEKQKQEEVPQNPKSPENERYSGEEVFNKLKSVLSWTAVSDTIYGDLYQVSERYPQTIVAPNQEDDFLLARISALTLDQRKEIASRVASLKFEVNVINDIEKKQAMAYEEAREISKIIFHELV